MQNQTSIYIPKPCNEDWNKMTPTQQGKFCTSCNKQVVDFSLMSDNQILNFISKQSGKVCGRFDLEQLERPLTETKIKKKKSWWMALTMPLLFLFDKSEAQSNTKLTGDTIYNTSPLKKTINEKLINKMPVCEPVTNPLLMDFIFRMHPKQITVTGNVVDENDNPVAYATIIQKATQKAVVSDSAGNFIIKINSGDSVVTLVSTYVGYEPTEQSINLNKKQPVKLKFQMQTATQGEVVVVGYATKMISGRLGGLSVCRKITTFQKTDTSFRKALGISNIYPNPAIKGSVINLKIKQAGEYQMQLFNNQSILIQTREINVDAEKSITQIQLPSNIAAGIYFLRLINEQTKKSNTEKLIIQ